MRGGEGEWERKWETEGTQKGRTEGVREERKSKGGVRE